MRRFYRYACWGGPVLLVFLLRRLDWHECLRLVRGLSLWPVLLGLATLPLEVMARASMFGRLSLLGAPGSGVPRRGVPIRLHRCVRIHLIDLAFAALTPGGVGGFLKLRSVREATHRSWTWCLSLVLWDKLLCLTALALFAIGGGFWMLTMFHGVSVMWPALALLALMTCVGVLPRLRRGCSALLVTLCPTDKGNARSAHLMQELVRMARGTWHHPRLLVGVAGLSLLSWLCVFTRVSAYAAGLHIPMDFGRVLLVWPSVVLVSLLPLFLGGLGVREGVLIAGCSLLRITQEQAVSLSLLEVMLFLLFPVVAGLLVYSQEDRHQEENPQENNPQEDRHEYPASG